MQCSAEVLGNMKQNLCCSLSKSHASLFCGPFNMLLGISKRISLTSQRYSGIAAHTAKCSFSCQEGQM